MSVEPALSLEHDLQGANTLGLPCVAERFVAAESPATLAKSVVLARQHDWPLTVLGGGSNLILPRRLPGLVIQPTFAEWRYRREAGGSIALRAEAGVNWHALVMDSVARGWWGIENLALIPGHCGAAPIQNIGAYGVELAEVLDSVEVLHLASGRQQTLPATACRFGYRDSIFKGALAGQVVITALTLRLNETPRPRLAYGDLATRTGSAPTSREVAEAVAAIRREKLPDPAQLGNAGSFFKNPLVSAEQAQRLLDDAPDMPHFAQPDGRVKLAAGWLIDRCGLKGLRHGPFGVHERQALVLVHHGGGDAEGLLAFADEIAAVVEARFGVTLWREPRLAG
ncbi:UDP-N-acetylmuramate dehydrogenase [Franzmannia pantelleriensis]|uniref:UDP-N-acetylenolpyruvoylglucosamine reductase n=1 Tax=Franzmannia pantelleriensis TaxID=48727 RepID=A0A1G9NQK2_9GAMM|nr:UDP-N-acetylmuramate dehydrogenase [Halomonas pantelleriensis]SDL88862.1 UDP-N-acetylmuramate dehydrogenase [Halomonas pantelleriensis]